MRANHCSLSLSLSLSLSFSLSLSLSKGGMVTTVDQTQPKQCTVHSQLGACYYLPKASGYMLTGTYAHGVRHIMHMMLLFQCCFFKFSQTCITLAFID